jgi:hypothetical protein
VITMRIPVSSDGAGWVASINMEVLVHVLAQKSLTEAKIKLDIKHAGYFILSFVRNFVSYLRYGVDTYVSPNMTFSLKELPTNLQSTPLSCLHWECLSIRYSLKLLLRVTSSFH